MFTEYINDAIHLTQGELFVKYWWLWLLAVIAMATAHFIRIKKKR